MIYMNILGNSLICEHILSYSSYQSIYHLSLVCQILNQSCREYVRKYDSKIIKKLDKLYDDEMSQVEQKMDKSSKFSDDHFVFRSYQRCKSFMNKGYIKKRMFAHMYDFIDWEIDVDLFHIISSFYYLENPEIKHFWSEFYRIRNDDFLPLNFRKKWTYDGICLHWLIQSHLELKKLELKKLSYD